jgi:hypothetical protein
MSAATDYLEGEWMKYAFTTTSTGTRPTAWYLALHTGDPGEAGTANEVTSGDDANYARQSATFTRTGGQCKNNGAVSFPAAETGADYTVTHMSLCDAASSGNVLYKGLLDAPRDVGTGTVISFAVDDLTLEVD